MKDDALLAILEQTAEKLSIKLDYDDIRKGDVVSYGDSFILRGERHILIDKKLNDREKVRAPNRDTREVRHRRYPPAPGDQNKDRD